MTIELTQHRFWVYFGGRVLPTILLRARKTYRDLKINIKKPRYLQV